MRRLGQAALDLGPEARARGGIMDGIEIYPTSRDIETRPCAVCGRPIVSAHDATSGRPVELETPRVFLEIGRCTDGRPLVAQASNGLALHACTPPAGKAS